MTGVYYPYMASIVGKRRGKRTYYYLVESARVHGKPRIVSQQYLGSTRGAGQADGGCGRQPIRSQHKRFGDLAAVWSTLARLGVAGIVDKVAPCRDAAASVGTYLALACANRIVDPCSKRGFADWWETTAGGRWVNRSGRAGSSPVLGCDGPPRRGRAAGDRDPHRPGDGDRVRPRPDRAGAGHDQLRHLHRHRQRARPDRARGKAKQKRTDLRLVGLALVLTRDGVPVITHAYPGDRPDVSQFPAVVDELVARYRDLVAGGGVADRDL